MNEIARGVVSFLDQHLGAIRLNRVLKHLPANLARSLPPDEQFARRTNINRNILRRGGAPNGPLGRLGLRRW
jgi:hypothetical protein